RRQEGRAQGPRRHPPGRSAQGPEGGAARGQRPHQAVRRAAPGFRPAEPRGARGTGCHPGGARTAAAAVPRDGHLSQGRGGSAMNAYRFFVVFALMSIGATALAAREQPPGNDPKGPAEGAPDLVARVAKNMQTAEKRLRDTDPGDETRK